MAFLLLLLVLPGTAGASNFTVTSTTDSTDANAGNSVCLSLAGGCTLRAAIQEANALAGPDVITVPAGTYQITLTGTGENAAATGDFDISSALTIQGAGPGATIVDAVQRDRVFDVVTGGTATFSGMTIENGNPGAQPGGGIQTVTSTTLSNVVITANHTTNGGGGIDNSNLLTITDSTISGNTASSGTSDGGGIRNSLRADLTRVTLTGNTAGRNGGGIDTTGFAPDGLHATDLTLTGNTAAAGGALFAGASAVLTRAVLSNNTATGAGGSLSGGAIRNTASVGETLMATDTAITGNHMPTNGQGAGIANSGDMNLTRVTVSSNTPVAGTGGAQGGGIYNTGNLATTDVEISGNSLGASSDGAGIWNSGNNMDLQRTTVAGNTTGGDGGGIWTNGFGPTLQNVTLSGNQATGSGGGMRTDADVSLLNVTIAGNTAAAAGGLLATAAFPSTTTSSIIAGNTGGDCAGGAAANTSGGNNLAGASCLFAAAGDITSSDPGLAALSANGGSVSTRALLPGSAAIDTGKDTGCPAVDARGVTRPQLSHCDIGAYEYSPPSSSVGPPACTQTGAIDGSVTAAAGGAPATALRFTLDGGAVQRVAVAGSSVALTIPEGTHALEYWGESQGGDEELAHHTATVLVDATAPVLTITSEQGTTSYTVGQRGSVAIAASDGGSGLAIDPSATGRALDTSRVGTVDVTALAGDNCGNQSTAAFRATVGLRRPVAARSVNLELVSGTVLVKVPGSSRFVPLTQPTQVRNGSIIDARHGRVRITIDNGHGGLDTADFYGGIFKFTQPKVKPGRTAFANLYLFGGSFRGCPRAPKNPTVATAKSKKRSVRRLWGAGEGAFRTVGRYSSATIRGTTWLTDDRCNGTLTRVTAGRVAVRDFVKKKTVIVRKGKRYFAAG